MTQRLDKVKRDKVRCPNSKLVKNGPETQNEKHSSPDKIGRLHFPFIQFNPFYFYFLHLYFSPNFPSLSLKFLKFDFIRSYVTSVVTSLFINSRKMIVMASFDSKPSPMAPNLFLTINETLQHILKQEEMLKRFISSTLSKKHKLQELYQIPSSIQEHSSIHVF